MIDGLLMSLPYGLTYININFISRNQFVNPNRLQMGVGCYYL